MVVVVVRKAELGLECCVCVCVLWGIRLRMMGAW